MERAWWFGLARTLGLGFGVVALSLAPGCFAGPETCPVSNCNPTSADYCSGTRIMTCVERDVLINDSGTVCPRVSTLREAWNCAREPGAECAQGECVLKSERCPAGSAGFCRDNQSHRCQGDRVLAGARDCTADGLECRTVTLASGESDGLCLIDTTPCPDPAPEHVAQCLDNAVVRCVRGYPYSKTSCESDELCRDEDDARCSIPADCPTSGTNVCYGDRVYGCERGVATPERLLDCGAHAEHCVVTAGTALCSPGSEALEPPKFVPIPGGTFQAGSVNPRSVTLPDFELLEREVSVADYAACVQAGVCRAPHDNDLDCTSSQRPGRPDLEALLPVTCVDLQQAEAYCAWLGGRIPTGDEWEFAARHRGAEVRFPWGDEPADCGHAIVRDDTLPDTQGFGCGRGAPWPGCARSSDRTAQGVCDLLGNVQEWTSDQVYGIATRGADFTTSPSAIAADALRRPTTQAGPYYGAAIGVRCAR